MCKEEKNFSPVKTVPAFSSSPARILSAFLSFPHSVCTQEARKDLQSLNPNIITRVCQQQSKNTTLAVEITTAVSGAGIG